MSVFANTGQDCCARSRMFVERSIYEPFVERFVAATRKLGGAVVRNRAKRLIREVFRRNKIAPGFDVVVIPKREFFDASLSTLEADYRNLVERHLRNAR